VIAQRSTPAAYRGREVLGPDGEHVGVVADVWPLDGGGEPELVLVQVGRRFRRERYLPLDGRAHLRDGALHVPWRRSELDDAPRADDRRWGDPAQLALSYWRDSAD
jgi:hypothetical protein